MNGILDHNQYSLFPLLRSIKLLSFKKRIIEHNNVKLGYYVYSKIKDICNEINDVL